MSDQSITIDDFTDWLADVTLPQAMQDILRCILSEVRLQADRFQPDTAELLNLATDHSPTYRALPADTQAFISAVLSLPALFFPFPLAASTHQWIQDNLP